MVIWTSKNKNLIPTLQATNEKLHEVGISQLSVENISFENLGAVMAAIAVKRKQLEATLNQVTKLKEQYSIELEYWRDQAEAENPGKFHVNH